MKCKFVDTQKPTASFDNIIPGNIFCWKGNYYLKLNNLLVFDVQKNEMSQIQNLEEPVFPVGYTLILED